MKEKTCCFTGHRNIPPGDCAKIQERLEDEIIRLLGLGVQYFGTGGALGFDTMAALTVLKLKPKFPYIRLILVLPCKDQTKAWCEEDIKIYNRIREKADKVVYISERYHRGCMYERNRHLADHSAFCVCYLTKKSGGTAYTVDYAKKKGLNTINLA